MKKTVCSAIALVGGLSANATLAQSQVNLYGIVDTGIEYVTRANVAGDSVIKMPSITGSFPSRLGFKGSEELGGGVQAIFVLESGLALDTGAMGQGNRLFGRQALVGISSPWGQVTMGRLLNMTYLAGLKSDVLGPNIFSIGSLDAYLPNARSDNALGYLGRFSGVTVGATYSFGRDASAAGGPAATGCAGEVAGNAKACRQVTGLLGYDGSGYGATASYDILYGNVGAANGLTSSNNSDERTTLNGYLMLKESKVGLGMVRRATHATPGSTDSKLYYLGVSYPASAILVLDGQIARLDVKRSANASTMVVVRLTCNLSKRTALYTSVGHMQNGGMAAVALDAGGMVAAGKNQAGVMAGIKHTF